MALIAWWKLDGNANDSLGKYNGYEVGSVSYSNGLIGNGYDNTAGASTGIELLRHSDASKYEKYYSVSLWFMSTSGSESSDVMRIISRDASEYMALVIDQTVSSSQNLVVYNGPDPSTNVELNRWYHFAYTVDMEKGEARVFINGILENTGTPSQSTAARPLVIGGNTEGDGDVSGQHFVGKIDDIKFYNHILSEKEVWEISNGLISHWKFDNEGLSYNFDNGKSQGWIFDVSSFGLRTDVSRSGGYSIGINQTDAPVDVAHLSPLELKGGKKIGMFEYYWYETSGSHGGGIAFEDSNGNEILGVATDNHEWDVYDAAGWVEIADNTISDYENWILFRIVFYWDTGEYYYYFEDTTTSDVRSGTRNLIYSTDVETIRIKNQNGESWVVSNMVMWFDDISIVLDDEAIDSTGNGNNGILSNNMPLWKNDSIIGNTACDFSIDYGHTFDLPITAIPVGDQISIAFWAKVRSSTNNNLIWFENSAGDRIVNIHLIYGNGNTYWDCGLSGTDYDRIQKSNPSVLNEWHHWVFQKNAQSGVMEIYLDTTLWHSGTGKSYSLPEATLGYMSDGEFDGLIDDFRIYGITLTTDEILELYQQRVSVDDIGSMHLREIKETKYTPLIADYTSWQVGTTGSQGSFSDNGSASENQIIEDHDPFGKQVPVWECIPDSNSDADGGWNMDFNNNNSNRLRMTVFVKRTGNNNGTTYHGCDNNDNTLNLDGSTNGNPYFWSGDLPSLDTWYLMVGIVHPNDYTGGDWGISGVYDMDGNKVLDGTEFKWGSGTNQELRDYLYYCTDTSVRQYFVYPRIDVLDGSEPTIEDLVNGADSRNYDHMVNIDQTSPQPMSITTKNNLISTINEIGVVDNILGFWRLDGDALDYSGNDYDGIINGATITSGLGQNAYNFNGTDQYIVMPSDPYNGALSDSDDTMSISVWLYPTSVSSNATNHGIQNCFVAHSSDNDNDNFELGVDYSTNALQVYLDTNIDDLTVTFSNTILTMNTWTFLVLTVDLVNGIVRAYKNGILSEESTSWSGSNTFDDAANTEFTIGASRSYREPFAGKIQDVRLYTDVLSAEEAAILYYIKNPNETQRVMQANNGIVYVKNEFIEY